MSQITQTTDALSQRTVEAQPVVFRAPGGPQTPSTRSELAVLDQSQRELEARPLVVVGPRQPVLVDSAGLMSTPDGRVVGGGGEDLASARNTIWSLDQHGASPVQILGTTATIEQVTIRGEAWLKITGTSAASAQVFIDLGSYPVTMGHETGVGAEIMMDQTGTQSCVIRWSPDASFSNFATSDNVNVALQQNNALAYRDLQKHIMTVWPGGPGWNPGFEGGWSTNRPRMPQTAQRFRVMFVNKSGQVPVGYIRNLFTTAPRKARLSITVDDGYKSAFRILAPIMHQYGLRATWGIITDLVSDAFGSRYMSERELRQLRDAGHDLCPHGPVGGTGNIITNYAGAASPVQAAVDDYLVHRNWLQQRGLLSQTARGAYIIPQGAFQSAIGDTAVLEGLRAAGVTHARTITRITGATQNMRVDWWPEPLALPIIGHAQEASEAAERANINAMVKQIGINARQGSDCILMLHEGVTQSDTAWGSNDQLNMRADHFDEICAAISHHVKEGNLDVVMMGAM